jgi:hypothetical protein
VSKYAEVAIRATELMRERACGSPPEAWRVAARELMPSKPDAQAKGCPKGAYLGLCEKGIVVGISAGSYDAGEENKGYAIDAVRLLLRDPSLATAGPKVLWERVMRGRNKKPNEQMEVVMALWTAGLIDRTRRP